MLRGRGEEGWTYEMNENFPKYDSSTLMCVFSLSKAVLWDFLSHIRQIPDVQPSVMKARRRYNNAFMPNSQFMKHDQPNGTKGNYKWQKHLAKHAISDKRLTKNSLAAYMCHNIHGHLIKVIPAFNPLPSF